MKFKLATNTGLVFLLIFINTLNVLAGGLSIRKKHLGPAKPVITFNAIPIKTYGAADFVLNVSSTNPSIPITFTISDLTVIQITNKTVHILSAGVVTIIAHQLTGDPSTDADAVPQVLTINKIPLTLVSQFQSTRIVYGAGIVELSSNLTGFLPGDTPDNSIATFAYEILSPTATTPVGTSRIVYGSLTIISAKYTVVFPTNLTATITPAPLLITADNVSRPYNTPNPPLTIAYTGFVNNETSAVLTAVPAISTTATASAPPGNYPITVRGAAAHNYAITYQNGMLSITGLTQTVTLDPIPNKTTSDPDFALIASATSGLPITFTSSDPSIISISGNKVKILQGGTVTVTATQAGNSIYAAASDSKTFTIISDEVKVLGNTFTPNNDGVNDLWKVEGLQNDLTATVSIYNRYGSVVYQNAGYFYNWNGQYRNTVLPVGVYYYVITAKSNTIKLSGSVTIIR